MKKILFLLLFAPVFSNAQTKTSKTASDFEDFPSSLSFNSKSLSTNIKVLVVVDGVIKDNNELAGSASNSSKYPYTVGPGQLGSLTVLKSEKAMALYGSKGKNGAIVITTKKQAK